MFHPIASAMAGEAANGGKGRVVIGWNKQVRSAHEQARLKYQIWIRYNKPKIGRVWYMCESKRIV